MSSDHWGPPPYPPLQFYFTFEFLHSRISKVSSNIWYDNTNFCSSWQQAAELKVSSHRPCRLLTLIPRRNAILVLSGSQEKHSVPKFRPQGSIPTFFFFWEVGTFVLIALKIPSGFLLLHDLVLLFLRRKRWQQEKCKGVPLEGISNARCCAVKRQCLQARSVDLTHLTSSVSSTLGSMMAGGRTSACRMTCRSASARPLDTEFTLTHFSVRPKSSSANIRGMVSLASVCKTQDTQVQNSVQTWSSRKGFHAYTDI